MKKYKAVIFDWSGTLSDDFEPCYLAFEANMRKYKGKEMGREEYKRRVRLPVKPFYEELGITAPMEEIRNHYYDFFSKCEIGVKSFAESEGVLKWLKERGVETAVLSAHTFVKKEAEEYGLLNTWTKFWRGRLIK